jgi:hypothetical protein
MTAAAFVLATSAAFADDVMASRYGKTTLSTDAKGVQTRIYYKSDGTFIGKQASQSFSGTWKLDASNTLCLTFSTTLPGLTNPTCVPASAHRVGDTWSGNGRTVTLLPGIQ